MEHYSIAPVVLILLCAVSAVTLCRSLKVPPMLGYLVVGFLAGPGVFHLIPGGRETDFLGEMGIVFLMFSIGLEFSLPKLHAMRKIVFGLGFSQVLITIISVSAVAWLILDNVFAAFAIACALTMSSTAIVSKVLTERVELALPHGQLAIGVLLFQDIAVVPLLILLPALASGSDTLLLDLGLAGIKIVGVMMFLFFIGQRVMRPLFHFVARQRSSELFMINVLLVTLGVAYLTELSGLSLALGAFIAGMLISETEYRFQVEEDIRPFRDILLGFFFITIGMKLEISLLKTELILIFGLLLGLLSLKLGLIFTLARVLKYKANESMKAALALAQGGEFGFVILALAYNEYLISSKVLQIMIAVILLSMLVAPFLIQYADWITRKVIKNDWMLQAANLHQVLVESMSRSEHVIICGYGRSGQALARLLETEDIKFIALDLDPERVREASEAGDHVVFGDSARKEVLIAAGVERAKAMVLTFCDTHAAERILGVAHDLNPNLPVIVRTLDDTDLDRLRKAGADEVVAEVMEGSLMLASQTFMVLEMPLHRILRRIRTVRESRYNLFQGYFKGNSNEYEEVNALQLRSVILPEGAFAVGCRVGTLPLERFEVKLKGIRRKNYKMTEWDVDLVLDPADTLVLLGMPEHLAAMEYYVLQGELE